MSMSTGESGGVSSEINVTPFIDILLVLLIIFMIVQALKRAAVDIQIPPVATGAMPTSAVSNQIVLELRDDGSYVINGQIPTSRDQLDRAFHEIYDQRPAKLLFVKPGPNRPYGEIIDAMDIARGAGVQVIGFTPIESNN